MNGLKKMDQRARPYAYEPCSCCGEPTEHPAGSPGDWFICHTCPTLVQDVELDNEFTRIFGHIE